MFLKDILVALGQDEEASELAQQWYRIFVLALPFCIAYYACEKFLSAQHTMQPLIVVALVSCGIILPVALEGFTEVFGFLGSAVAYVFYQASSAVLLLLYLKWKQPHMAEPWPGLGAWREALHRENMMEYLYLGAGGILGQSEWIFWEALGLIVGRLGVVPLTAHDIPNNIIMAIFQIPYALGIALTIRIGTTISESVTRAKKIALATLIATTALFGLVSIILYVKAESVIRIFTFDEDVIELSKSVWWKVCTYNLNVAVFGVLSGISTGLGYQWTFGAVNFFFLWVVGIPVTMHHAVILGGGLDAAWTWINAPYLGINLCLLIIFARTDWNAVRDKIQDQNEPSPSLELEEVQKASRTNDEQQTLLDEKKQAEYGSNGV
jgi:MATE family multidrug resistance protein